MSLPIITYAFEFQDGTAQSWTVDVGRKPARVDDVDLPEWTRLSYERCSNCPLPDDDPRARCPAAVDAAAVLERFHALFSYERALVSVHTPDREYRRDCDLQTALHSLVGLIMATSGCPILRRLRAMAEFHLPFATQSETLYRTVSNHLLKQYFARQRGEPGDSDEFEELRETYRDLQIVNAAFVRRITAAAERDANLNAIVLLFTVSALIQASLDEDLEELSRLYDDD